MGPFFAFTLAHAAAHAATASVAGDGSYRIIATGDSDLDAVHARLLHPLLWVNDPVVNNGCNISGARDFARALLPNGAWPDVNYTDRTRTGAWQPERHLRRQLAMAISARQTYETHNRTDVALVAAVHRSLSFWFQGDAPNGTTYPMGRIHSANWFTGEIWDNAVLGNTALAFEPWLTSAERHLILVIMERANWQKFKRTGANLISELSIQIKRGVLARNASLVYQAFQACWSNIKVSQPTGGCMYEGCLTDGIQADRSYHQHGAQLLAGSYGAYAARETVVFLGLANGTRFFMESGPLQLLVELLLDGMRWMMVHQYYWDWSVVGRSLSSHIARPADALGHFLPHIPSNRSHELREFAASMANGEGTIGSTKLRGHRAFWCSDYAVQSSESAAGIPWVATLLMHSNRTSAAACVNGQGAMNEHVGDAMMYLYYNGTEYDGVFNVWQWNRLPGITAEQIPVEPCAYMPRLKNDSALMDRTGTVSNGVEGLSAMFLVSHNLTAKKSTALLQNVIVNLVADVRCNSSNEIYSTVDSGISAGDLTVATTDGSLITVPVGTARRMFKGGVLWVHHGKTAYVFEKNTTTTVEVTHEYAHRTSGNSRLRYEVGIPHGSTFTSGLRESVVWSTIPGVSLAQMKKTGVETGVSVVANTGEAQAIMSRDRLQGLATFWGGAGGGGSVVAFPTPLNFSIASSHPVTIIVNKTAKSLIVTASDPTNNQRGIDLVLSVSIRGLRPGRFCPCDANVNGSTRLRIRLPSGWDAGKSTVVKCRIS